MGGDGGSIPKRIELVRSRQKPEQVGKDAELAARWMHCQLSQELLQRPIVACQLGRMYNKTAALEFLLDREKFGAPAATFAHVKSLRDLRELRLADNPEHRPEGVTKGGGAAASAAYGHAAAPQFACPVSGVEMNGRFRFLFPWACGCVVAEKALERLAPGVGGDGCPVCQRPGALADLVQLNPAGEAELATVTAAMSARRPRSAGSATNPKEGGGKRKAANSDGVAAPPSSKVSRPAFVAGSTASQSAPASAARPAASGAGSTASAARPAASGAGSTASAARPAASGAGSTASAARPAASGAGSARAGGSVQDDPNASSAFKSLFTSSKEAKSQSKAHWVTFNPGYFR